MPGRSRDDGLGIHDETELVGFSIRHEVRVFRRLPSRHEWGRSKLQPSQPFHIDVALETWQEQPQGISLFRPQRVAILAIAHHGFVQHFIGERHTASQCSRIAPLCQQPGCFRRHVRRFQQGGEVDPGPFAGAGETMQSLNGCIPSLIPPIPAVPGTFYEGHARCRREPHQFLKGEDHGTIDLAVYQQAMAGRINRGHTVMVPLKVEGGRGDDSLQVLERSG